MKKTKKAKRKKKSLKSVGRLFQRQKWVITGTVVVVIVLAALVYTQRRARPEGALQKPPGKATSIKTINATSNAFWLGNDPALEHEIGSEEAGDSWSSAGDASGYMILGPHVNLGPDYYMISLQIRVDGLVNASTRVGRIDITKNGGGVLLVRKDLYGRDLRGTGGYTTFPITLVSSKSMEDVEFRVYHLNKVNMSVKRIDMNQAPMVWYGNDPALSHEIGEEEDGGVWASGTDSEGYVVSGGPTINIAPGVYTISYTFVVDKGYLNDSEHISTMEVSHSRGSMSMWNGGQLRGYDYNTGRLPDNSLLKSFGNTIDVVNPLNNVEFKLYHPNNTVNVKLVSITLYSR